jgi:hypothetical protein
MAEYSTNDRYDNGTELSVPGTCYRSIINLFRPGWSGSRDIRWSMPPHMREMKGDGIHVESWSTKCRVLFALDFQ